MRNVLDISPVIPSCVKCVLHPISRRTACSSCKLFLFHCNCCCSTVDTPCHMSETAISVFRSFCFTDSYTKWGRGCVNFDRCAQQLFQSVTQFVSTVSYLRVVNLSDWVHTYEWKLKIKPLPLAVRILWCLVFLNSSSTCQFSVRAKTWAWLLVRDEYENVKHSGNVANFIVAFDFSTE